VKKCDEIPPGVASFVFFINGPQVPFVLKRRCQRPARWMFNRPGVERLSVGPKFLCDPSNSKLWPWNLGEFPGTLWKIQTTKGSHPFVVNHRIKRQLFSIARC